MTYSSKENSVALGRPKILVKFYDDFGTEWRYNSGATSVTHLSQAYTPDICKVSELEITSKAFTNQIDIELSRENSFAAPFLVAPLESKVSVVIYRLLDSDYIYYWSGVVESVNFNKDAIPTINCYPKTSSASRVGRRRVGQILCDVALYSQEIGECLVDKNLFKIEGIIDAIDDTTLTSSSFSDEDEGWLKGGEIVIGNARRLIVSHTLNSGGAGGTIEINRAIQNPESNSAGEIEFVAYAGCDHTKAICVSKFDNGINYAGQEALPTKNPYVGDPIMY